MQAMLDTVVPYLAACFGRVFQPGVLLRVDGCVALLGAAQGPGV